MIVAPGGGHTQLVIEKEGWEIADWLNSNGIAAFVLKYRLARAQGSKYKLPDEVYADAARSVRLVRSRAAEWGVDPGRIGFIGFSAGGEVAGMIETRFADGKSDAEDPVERVSSRPDFKCPGVSVLPPWRQPARRPAAIPGAERRASGLPGLRRRRPLARGATVKFYLELEAQHISTEMHIYSYGGHGICSAAHPASGAGDGLAGAVEGMAGRSECNLGNASPSPVIPLLLSLITH